MEMIQSRLLGYEDFLENPQYAEEELRINQSMPEEKLKEAFIACYSPILGTGYLSPFGEQRLARNVREYKDNRIIPSYVARYLEVEQKTQ